MLYELKVVMKHIEPPVWRTIQVPENATLHRLHEVLQVAMGWTNSHLYLFHVGGKAYSEPSPEWEPDVLDSTSTTLEEIVSEGRASFGDYLFQRRAGGVQDIRLPFRARLTVRLPAYVEQVQVRVGPSHGDLQHFVQTMEGRVLRDLDCTPDRGLDVLHHYFQLVQHLTGLQHCSAALTFYFPRSPERKVQPSPPKY